MASDYTYDEDGQLWPYFVFTLSCIITLPLTYLLATGGRDTAALFPRIKTDYKPRHADVVEAQRAKVKRKQRRVGLGIAVAVGWAAMSYMMYLIATTEVPPAQKLWNPYDILGISEVRQPHPLFVVRPELGLTVDRSRLPSNSSRAPTSNSPEGYTPTRSSQTRPRTRRWSP